LPAVSFGTETGREPVRRWLQDLAKAEPKIIGINIMFIQFRWPLGMPLVANIGSGIREVRGQLPMRTARILFFVHEREIILLHGFIKKPGKLERKTGRSL
jgi:phage-related protein